MGKVIHLIFLAVCLVRAHGCSSTSSGTCTTPCKISECESGSCVNAGSEGIRSCPLTDYDDFRKKRAIPRYVYRVLRSDEDPANGLSPKDPTQTRSVQSHVGCGSRSGYTSQYISTSASRDAAIKWANLGGNTAGVIVRIDTFQIDSSRLIDLTDGGDGENLTGVTAINAAICYQEVLIEGFVPAAAITRVPRTRSTTGCQCRSP